MNVWLVCGLVLLLTMLPLLFAALHRPPIEGLPALQVAGVNASLALFVLAIGMNRQPFVDLALVVAVLSFAGTIAFASVLERRR